MAWGQRESCDFVISWPLEAKDAEEWSPPTGGAAEAGVQGNVTHTTVLDKDVVGWRLSLI